MAVPARRLSYWDTLRLQLHVGLPAFALGLVVPNRAVHSWVARRNATARTLRFLQQMREKYGEHAWTWFPLHRTLVVFAPSTVETLFTSDANAADPTLKRRALSRFAPDSLVISSGDAWTERRAFNERALDLERPLRHGEAFAGIAIDEARKLLDPPRTLLRWRDFQSLAKRISHRIVLGGADERIAYHLERMLAWSNLLLRNPWAYHRFYRRLQRHLARARPRESSRCLIDEDMWLDSGSGSGKSTIRTPSQVGFWMFVLKDAVEIHVARTLALLAAHRDVQATVRQEIRAAGPLTPSAIDELRYLEACIMEQLRLWTPVPLLLRRVLTPMSLLDNISLRKGDQILFHAGFHHRDRRAFGDVADRFAPDLALAGRREPANYAFSAHRQRCAGRTLVLFVLKATLASLFAQTRFELVSPSIERAHVGYSYDHFSLQLRAIAIDDGAERSSAEYGDSLGLLPASRP